MPQIAAKRQKIIRRVFIPFFFAANVGKSVEIAKFLASQKRPIFHGAKKVVDYEKKSANRLSGIFSFKRDLRVRNVESVVLRRAAI